MEATQGQAILGVFELLALMMVVIHPIKTMKVIIALLAVYFIAMFVIAFVVMFCKALGF